MKAHDYLKAVLMQVGLHDACRSLNTILGRSVSPHSLQHPLLHSRPHMPQFHIHNLILPSQPPCEGGVHCTYMTDEDMVTQKS